MQFYSPTQAQPRVMQTIEETMNAIDVAQRRIKVHNEALGIALLRTQRLYLLLKDVFNGVNGAKAFTSPEVIAFADVVQRLTKRAERAVRNCSRGTLYCLVHLRSLDDEAYALNVAVTDAIEAHRDVMAPSEQALTGLVLVGADLSLPEPGRLGEGAWLGPKLLSRVEVRAYLVGNLTAPALVASLANSRAVDREQLLAYKTDVADEHANVVNDAAGSWEPERKAVQDRLMMHVERLLAGLRPHVVVPGDWICPISGELMWDPVLVPETGQTYDRKGIEQWFSTGNRTDPKTNQVLTSTAVFPVLSLRNTIREFLRLQEPFRGVPEADWPELDCSFKVLDPRQNIDFTSKPPPIPESTPSTYLGSAIAPPGLYGQPSIGSTTSNESRPGWPGQLHSHHVEPPYWSPPQPNAPPFEDNRPTSYSPPRSPGYGRDEPPEWKFGNYMLYSGAEDGLVKIWGLNNKCLKSLRGHSKRIHSLAVADYDGSVYSGSGDCTIRRWLNGRFVSSLEGHTKAVYALALSPAGLLFSGSGDATIRVWRDDRVVTTLRDHGDSVTALVAAHDGSVYSGSLDGSIRRWSEDRVVAAMQAHDGGVQALALTPDGVLFSAGRDKMVRSWHNDRLAGELKGHSRAVNALAFGSEGELYSASLDCTVKKWVGGTCAATGKANGELVALAYAPTDKSLYVGAAGTDNVLFARKNDRAISVWQDMKLARYLDAQESGSVWALTVGPDLQADDHSVAGSRGSR